MPGQAIISEGDRSDQIYLVKDGTAEVFTGPASAKQVLSRLASTKVEVLSLPKQVFQTVLDSMPDVQRKVNEVIAQRARENLDKISGSWAARYVPPAR